MKISGNVFVVAGGASGLGAATAQALVEQGGKALVADVNEEAGRALVNQLSNNACFVRTDVTDAASASAALEAAAAMGTLRGLINCAGIATGEKVVGRQGAHGLETFTRTININLIGSFNMLRLAAQIMAQTEPQADGERGVIVNTASVAAFDGQIGQAAYSASKGGIVAMTLPIARELATSGIRVLAIAPGIMETPMLMGLPQNVQDSLGATVPFPKRLGKPAEFAALVEHIIGNQYLNGEVIRLDGAIRMAAK